MKKLSFPAFLFTFLLLLLFWMLLTGQIADIFRGGFSWQILAAGILVCGAAALFCGRFFAHEELRLLLQPKRLGALLVYCLAVFPWELIRFNVDMAVRAFSPGLPKKSGIVKIPTALTSEYALSMLANSITLTPGTLTVDIVTEDGKNYFYIHWIDVASDDPEEAAQAIKGRLEKWIGRIWS